MRLVHILLVAGAMLLAMCDPAAGTDQTNSMQAKNLNRVRSNDEIAILNYKRFLRSDNGVDVQDEERSLNNFVSVSSLKAWLRKDFSRNTLEKMLKNPAFQTKMLKLWDQNTINEVSKRIGEKNLGNEAIKKMYQTYVRNRRIKMASRWNRDAR
ncbi:unnamed protein product [Phytophthora lilii]|uniref:RxLR effector protein n=1 Tax=Phytophthora lilii TaxID=2077276 RepID=A0A9W6TFJ7_9STRA|nr:unnamed protein product [Phytophthora lilii]